ncbi:hypothetical protein [Luteimonas kalidii]|uniref:Uncharacterized protein n=1 Tax=Luteimonas kalidii TaxID=3042025 RepID=A0ABT6JNQ2_9GAMM|nr:hypothetical protein [Luteimonas kalidii]MDH5832316.1 hypothetical protein [Luteimonas kalidii]
MFAERGPNESVFYSGGNIIRHTVVEGDDLTLRSGDQDVLVRNVSILGPDHYRGTIYGFEPSRVTELNGLELDQEIEFYDKNIFAVRGA